jgi:ectoine hydroxylase-related dioxygenase (phytanoyl-CoA dioxygenase family)
MRTGEATRERCTARHLDEAGYAVVEGFIDGAGLLALRREVDDALRAAPAPAPGCERPHNRLVALRWSDATVDLLLADERRRRTVATVTAGADLRWISGYVSVKEPRTPALWWHQDWWCWSHPVTLRRSAAQVALLVYLSETTESTGALRVLPGSHHTGVPLHATLPAAHAEGAELPSEHAAVSDQPGQVTLAVGAGDAVVLDYRLLHGTHPNASARRRDCVLLSFTPSWGDLPVDVRAHLVQHLALPTDDEPVPAAPWRADLLPTFAGIRADLEVDRVAPAHFGVRD